jgi:hypothetical protein
MFIRYTLYMYTSKARVMKDDELKFVFDVEVGKIETTIFITTFALSIEIFLSIYCGS